jgi:hypothetical protein
VGQIICVFSDLTETELLNSPENVKEHFKNLPKQNIERVLVTDEILILATKYVPINTCCGFNETKRYQEVD